MDERRSLDMGGGGCAASGTSAFCAEARMSTSMPSERTQSKVGELDSLVTTAGCNLSVVTSPAAATGAAAEARTGGRAGRAARGTPLFAHITNRNMPGCQQPRCLIYEAVATTALPPLPATAGPPTRAGGLPREADGQGQAETLPEKQIGYRRANNT